MKHAKGSIVNISSRSGIIGIPVVAAYAASKAAACNHTKSVALTAVSKYMIFAVDDHRGSCHSIYRTYVIGWRLNVIKVISLKEIKSRLDRKKAIAMQDV